MNRYEILGIAVANGIVYVVCSAILGALLCCFFTKDATGLADFDELPKFAWISGCVVCVVMVLRCIY